MNTTKRKTLSALLILTVSVSLAWADNPVKTSIDYAETASVMVQKLHADVNLSSGQQTQIADLTVVYFQERQAVLDAAEQEWLAEEAARQSEREADEVIYPYSLTSEVIEQLGKIEDRYQAAINEVLSPEQRAAASAKREERKPNK